MADDEQEQTDEEQPAKSGGLGNVIMFAVVGLVAAGGGFAVPFFFPGLVGGQTTVEEPKAPSPAFVPFGEIVVNLDEGRLNRYLRVSITLQVDEDKLEKVTKLVEERKVILKNWLLSNISDKAMEEMDRAAGSIGRGEFPHAIRHYMRAWEFAIKAL